MSAVVSKTPDRLSPDSLTPDQQNAITRLVEHDHTLLIAGMGAGKTIIALSAAQELLNEGVLKKILVVAPMRVALRVWKQEAQRWKHIDDYRVGVAYGSPGRRTQFMTQTPYQIVVLSVDNLAWACKSGLLSEFDGLILDESTRLKTPGSEAVKALRRHIKGFKWRVSMSGTPVVEGLDGLYAQMLMVDGGATLGRNHQNYLDRYFMPTDWNRYNWVPRPGQAEAVAKAVAPFVYMMPDYRHELPPVTVEAEEIELSASARAQYVQLARAGVLEGVTAVNEAVLRNKLHQAASGFVYTDDEYDGEVVLDIHQAKFDATLDWMRQHKRGIIVYQWNHQRDWLKANGVPLFTDGKHIEERWNARNLAFMGLHPKSAAHGLNLQYGGSRMLMMAPQWSRDLHDQVIARLWRRGQAHPVHVDILAAADTVDDLILEVLDGKREASAAFHAHLESLTA